METDELHKKIQKIIENYNGALSTALIVEGNVTETTYIDLGKDMISKITQLADGKPEQLSLVISAILLEYSRITAALTNYVAEVEHSTAEDILAAALYPNGEIEL